MDEATKIKISVKIPERFYREMPDAPGTWALKARLMRTVHEVLTAEVRGQRDGERRLTAENAKNTER